MPCTKSGSVRFGLALWQLEPRRKVAIFSLKIIFPFLLGPNTCKI